MDKILTAIGGTGLVIFIYWFFFGKKDESVGVTYSQVKIEVSGGYKPSVVKIKKGEPVKFIFTRTDESSCLEEVIFPDFKIKKYLPLNEKVEIEISPSKAGEYEFHCGMNMFHGKVIVEK